MEHIEIDDDRLELAVKAAERAGASAESVKHTTSKELKDNNMIVTEADKEAEHIVREILSEESSLPILGEEHGGDVSEEDSYWVVDPIDGTTNFSHGQPIYGSAVGLVEDNEPVVGVVYMPEFDYLFYAVDGEGAYRNHDEIEIADATIDERLYTSLSGVGTKKFYDGVGEVSYWIQELHSAVASECWVASSWSDLGVFGALAPWDMAAGTVIVREAGGVLQNVETGEEDWDALKDGRVVFGKRELVEDFREELSEETIENILSTVYEE